MERPSRSTALALGAATAVLVFVIVLCAEETGPILSLARRPARTTLRIGGSTAYSTQSFSQSQWHALPPPPPHPASSSSSPPPLNTTTCLWVNFANAGRAGNRLRQMEQVTRMLAHCSGVAVSSDRVNRDKAMAFPPLLVGAAAASSSTSSSGNDNGREAASPVEILETAARHCRELDFSWTDQQDPIEGCAASPAYTVGVPPYSGHGGAGGLGLLSQVYPERSLWAHAIPSDAMAMYFRGGDILERDWPKYHQAPCSLFMEAWRAANASSVYLIYDPKVAVNPCVDVVRRQIPPSKIVTPPCDSASCHMTLLARAPFVVVSGVTTYAHNAMDLLIPRTRRVYFEYFCDHEPRVSHKGLKVCVAGETEGLVPWQYNESTRTRMLEYGARVVLPNEGRNLSAAAFFRAYLGGRRV